jgi:hypothetical protein
VNGGVQVLIISASSPRIRNLRKAADGQESKAGGSD